MAMRDSIIVNMRANTIWKLNSPQINISHRFLAVEGVTHQKRFFNKMCWR